MDDVKGYVALPGSFATNLAVKQAQLLVLIESAEPSCPSMVTCRMIVFFYDILRHVSLAYLIDSVLFGIGNLGQGAKAHDGLK